MARNWKWIALSIGVLALLVVGTVALGQSTSQQVQPTTRPTAATTADRVDNCESWHVYATMANIEFPYEDEDECRAAVLEDSTKFTEPPSDDDWDNVEG